jgi:predicted small lipoprotein YifL
MVYRTHRPVFFLAILVFGLLLPACGKKGALYMPENKPASTVPASVPPAAPSNPSPP